MDTLGCEDFITSPPLRIGHSSSVSDFRLPPRGGRRQSRKRPSNDFVGLRFRPLRSLVTSSSSFLLSTFAHRGSDFYFFSVFVSFLGHVAGVAQEEEFGVRGEERPILDYSTSFRRRPGRHEEGGTYESFVFFLSPLLLSFYLFAPSFQLTSFGGSGFGP